MAGEKFKALWIGFCFDGEAIVPVDFEHPHFAVTQMQQEIDVRVGVVDRTAQEHQLIGQESRLRLKRLPFRPAAAGADAVPN